MATQLGIRFRPRRLRPTLFDEPGEALVFVRGCHGFEAEHPQVSPVVRQVYGKVVRLKPERERHVPVDRWVRNRVVVQCKAGAARTCSQKRLGR